MVEPTQLGLQLVNWIALFIPALAIMLNAVTRVYDGNEVLELFGLAEGRKTEIFMISTICFGMIFGACVLLFVYLIYEFSLPLFSLTNPDVLITGSIVLILLALLLAILFLRATYLANRVSVREPDEELEEMWENDPEFVLYLLNQLLENRQVSKYEAMVILSSISDMELEEVNEMFED